MRKNSFNKSILNFVVENAPNNCIIETFDIAKLPFFNQDLELDPPKSVIEFREKISSSDALLIAVAEYNFSISGVLKNAIEWASRPYASAVLNHKPVAIMGASNGMLGTGRAQYHLRQMLV